jgi:hypothetical protein
MNNDLFQEILKESIALEKEIDILKTLTTVDECELEDLLCRYLAIYYLLNCLTKKQ